MRHFHELKDDSVDSGRPAEISLDSVMLKLNRVALVCVMWGECDGWFEDLSWRLAEAWRTLYPYWGRVLSVTGFVAQVSEGLSACEATFGKTGDQAIFIFIFMGEELKPLQHIDHAHRHILEKHISSCFSCCERILVWKMKISCQRTFRARVFNSGSDNFLLICRRQSDNYVCWIQNDSFHNPFDALSGLHSPHKRSWRLFIVCLRPRQRWEIIQVWISRMTFPSCTFV